MTKFSNDDINHNDIASHLSPLMTVLQDGEYREIRLIKPMDGRKYCGTLGYYRSVEEIMSDIGKTITLRAPQTKSLSASETEGTVLDSNTYVSANAVKHKDWGQASNPDVLRRTIFLIDIDPERDGMCPSTPSEMEASMKKHDEVLEFLQSDCGLLDDQRISMMSGNGTAIQIFIDLQNDHGNKERIKAILSYLTERFSDDGVHIDTTVCDGPRIMRVSGFPNIKGEETEGRKYRLARLLHAPQNPVIYDLAHIEKNIPVKNESLLNNTIKKSKTPLTKTMKSKKALRG